MRHCEIAIELTVGRLWPLVALAVVLGLLAWGGAAGAEPPATTSAASLAAEPGFYYLATVRSYGADADTACIAGYHMASLWEVLDVSNLTYDPVLGYQRGDSGQGPPTPILGWVRTGDMPNMAKNCASWTSSSDQYTGTVVGLPDDWTAPGSTVGVWTAGTRQCSQQARVWCVGSPVRLYVPLVLRNY